MMVNDMKEYRTENKQNSDIKDPQKNNGRTNHVRVNPDFFKRAAKGAGAIVLAAGVLIGGVLVIKGYTDKNDISEVVEAVKSNDLAVIEKIISNGASMYETRTREQYTVKYGDTISDIAENYNCFSKDIMFANDLRDSNIKEGDTLFVDRVQDLPETVKEVNFLESYFRDYVLSSSEAAKIAKGEGINDKYKTAFQRALFSKDDSEYNSIEVLFQKAYNAYHSIEYSEEKMQEYIELLLQLVELTESRINIVPGSEFIIPYEQYLIYMKNRSTEYNELMTCVRTPDGFRYSNKQMG